jgi:hypothetical protein
MGQVRTARMQCLANQHLLHKALRLDGIKFALRRTQRCAIQPRQ